MVLENIQPCGWAKPGDLVEVPDDVGFDKYHWRISEHPQILITEDES